MLICKKCGIENPLGRVFCGACGGRLDLAGMVSASMAQGRGASWFSRFWGLLVAFLILVVLGIASQCLVARTAPVGEVGNRSDLAAVTRPLRLLMNLGRGRSVGVDLPEKSINAFLALKARRLGAESITVSTGEGYFNVRLVQVADPLGVGSFEYIPRFSYDYTFVPVGGAVGTRRVAMGRLRLTGPLKTMAVRKLLALASGLDEWKAFANVTEIRAEDGKIWVKATK